MFYRSVKKARISLIVGFVAIVIASLSLCMLPLTSGTGADRNNLIAYLIATLFWLGWIIAVAAEWFTGKILYRYRRKLVMKNGFESQTFPGVISFSAKPLHLVLYAVIISGMALIITDILFAYIPEMIMAPILSVTILSFAIHCVIDGKYYKFYHKIKENVNNETNH